MTPEEWARARVYDPTFDQPYPDEAPTPEPFQWAGLMIAALAALAALAIGAVLAVGLR